MCIYKTNAEYCYIYIKKNNNRRIDIKYECCFLKKTHSGPFFVACERNGPLKGSRVQTRAAIAEYLAIYRGEDTRCSTRG